MNSNAFAADLARFDSAFRAADAIRTEEDGYTWIDQSKIPVGLALGYQRLMQYGYANGLI